LQAWFVIYFIRIFLNCLNFEAYISLVLKLFGVYQHVYGWNDETMA